MSRYIAYHLPNRQKTLWFVPNNDFGFLTSIEINTSPDGSKTVTATCNTGIVLQLHERDVERFLADYTAYVEENYETVTDVLGRGHMVKKKKPDWSM